MVIIIFLYTNYIICQLFKVNMSIYNKFCVLNIEKPSTTDNFE